MAKIDGIYEVPDELVEFFFNGDDGSRVTNAQWDATRDLYREHDAWPFDHLNEES